MDTVENDMDDLMSYEEMDELDFNDTTDDISSLNEDINFSDAVIWGTDWTLETIYQQISKGNIDLNPNFQRRDAWDDIQKSLLIESFITGMPVPPIILAEKKNEKGKYLVIDGKQRLLTICQFCSNDTKFGNIKLKKLTFIKGLNGKTYSDLSGELLMYKDMFDNQTIRTIVIKNWQKEQFLYSIFLRLNTGTKRLSTQELRQALHPGAFLSFLDEATSDSIQFKKLLKNEQADSRMRDVELALRAFALKYYFADYRGDLKSFLDNACFKLNESWKNNESEIKEYYAEVEKAIDFTYEVFDKYAFSKPSSRYSFNRALYEIFIYYFSIEDVRFAVVDNNLQNAISDAFTKLCKNDRKFSDCISSSFKNMKNVEYRFKKIYELINSIANIQIPKIELSDSGFIIK